LFNANIKKLNRILFIFQLIILNKYGNILFNAFTNNDLRQMLIKVKYLFRRKFYVIYDMGFGTR